MSDDENNYDDPKLIKYGNVVILQSDDDYYLTIRREDEQYRVVLAPSQSEATQWVIYDGKSVEGTASGSGNVQVYKSSKNVSKDKNKLRFYNIDTGLYLTTSTTGKVKCGSGDSVTRLNVSTTDPSNFVFRHAAKDESIDMYSTTKAYLTGTGGSSTNIVRQCAVAADAGEGITVGYSSNNSHGTAVYFRALQKSDSTVPKKFPTWAIWTIVGVVAFSFVLALMIYF